MSRHIVRLQLDASPLLVAIEQLKLLAEDFPEAVELFLHNNLGVSELFRVDSGNRSAIRTGEHGILLEPSERLREFLSTPRTRDVGCVPVEV